MIFFHPLQVGWWSKGPPLPEGIPQPALVLKWLLDDLQLHCLHRRMKHTVAAVPWTATWMGCLALFLRMGGDLTQVREGRLGKCGNIEILRNMVAHSQQVDPPGWWVSDPILMLATLGVCLPAPRDSPKLDGWTALRETLPRCRRGFLEDHLWQLLQCAVAQLILDTPTSELDSSLLANVHPQGVGVTTPCPPATAGLWTAVTWTLYPDLVHVSVSLHTWMRHASPEAAVDLRSRRGMDLASSAMCAKPAAVAGIGGGSERCWPAKPSDRHRPSGLGGIVASTAKQGP